MNKSLRISTGFNVSEEERYINIKLEQDIDVLEVLTVDIKTKDIYRNFNSDYGVLIGRVIANEGIGVPNVKVSIFIPLSEEDEKNEDVLSVYPFKTPRDSGPDGKRYNLLPRVSEYNDLTKSYKPNQPFGSFPTKPEIVTNRTLLNVYKKYYKFTTVTNENGDYIIFGTPVGLHTVHISVDISDIGKYSMTPKSMVTFLGYPETYFTSDSTRIKQSIDLDDLPNIETQEIDVNIRPFWGDKDNFEIGITRQDFRIRAEIVNTVIICGSAFSDNDNTTWGIDRNPLNGTANTGILYGIKKLEDNDTYAINDDVRDNLHRLNMINIINTFPSTSNYPGLSILNKKTATIKEDIYYYDLNNNIQKLEKNQYVKYTKGGSFVYEIRCNRNKIKINEVGEEVEVPDTEMGGVFKNFYGFFIFDLIDDNFKHSIYETYINKPDLIEENKYHYTDVFYKFQTRIKVPQVTVLNEENNNKAFSFIKNEDGFELVNGDWFSQYKKFEGGKIYTISKFNPIINNEGSEFTTPDIEVSEEELEKQVINSSDIYNTNPNNNLEYTSGQLCTFQSTYPSNFTVNTNSFFGGNWINGSIYLPVITHITPNLNDINVTLTGFGWFKLNDAFGGFRVSSLFSSNLSRKYKSIDSGGNNPFGFTKSQENILFGTSIENSRCLRNDLHWSDFTEINKDDLSILLEKISSNEIDNGFIVGSGETIESLSGEFRNAVYVINDENNMFNGFDPCPFGGGKIDLDVNNDDDPKTYFYFGDQNCLLFLNELNII